MSEQTQRTKLKSFAEVQPMEARFLLAPYLRAGNLNLIRGDGGSGKTMLSFAFIAAVTHGNTPPGMPGVLNCPPSNCIYFGAEDDKEEYRHRLDLCGADVQRVFTVERSDMPTLGAVSQLQAYILEIGAKLIVIDPIQAFLPPKTDLNDSASMRPLLDALREVCRSTDCTCIIIEHLNKCTKMKAAYRGIGTVDIINASRSAIFVGYHPSERGMRAAVHIKANAGYGDAIAFRIGDSGKFQWCGTCDVTEDQVAGASRTDQKKQFTSPPVLEIICALMQKHPGGWSGTASQILEETSELCKKYGIASGTSIGRSIPRIEQALRQRGIEHMYTEHMRKHWFYPSQNNGGNQPC